MAQRADPGTRVDLLAELRGYPGPPGLAAPETPDEIAVALRPASPAGKLRLLTTTVVLGTALDVTLPELAIKTFLPADAATAEALRRMAAGR